MTATLDPSDDPRPWEQPGAVRRDCEPHRAPALLLLGRVAASVGGLSVALSFVYPALFHALLGGSGNGPDRLPLLPAAFLAALVVLLSAGVLWAAERDLARMRTGSMAPAGRGQTWDAAELSGCGLATGLCTLLAMLCYGLWAW